MANDAEIDAHVARLMALLAGSADIQVQLAEKTDRSSPIAKLTPSLNTAANRARASEILRLADVKAPRDFDSAGMWKAINAAFFEAELRADAAALPSKEDVKAMKAMVKAARHLASASDHLWKHHRTAGIAIATRIRLRDRGNLPPHHQAVADFLWFTPFSTDVLQQATENAFADLDQRRKSGAPLPLADGEPATAWLWSTALPTVAQTYLGIAPTFTPAAGTTVKPSACVRFIQAVYIETNREQPTDVAIVKVVSRAKAAGSTTQPCGTRTPVSRTRTRKTKKAVQVT